jgi:hypothetical protein
MTPYVFDHGWEPERERLAGLGLASTRARFVIWNSSVSARAGALGSRRRRRLDRGVAL